MRGRQGKPKCRMTQESAFRLRASDLGWGRVAGDKRTGSGTPRSSLPAAFRTGAVFHFFKGFQYVSRVRTSLHKPHARTASQQADLSYVLLTQGIGGYYHGGNLHSRLADETGCGMAFLYAPRIIHSTREPSLWHIRVYTYTAISVYHMGTMTSKFK